MRTSGTAPYYAEGFGLTQAEAADAALQSMDAAVDAIRELLPPGQEAVVVINHTAWNPPTYTITFCEWVIDTGT